MNIPFLSEKEKRLFSEDRHEIALKLLTPLELQYWKERFGGTESGIQSYTTIALKFNVSRQYVHQVLSGAFTRIESRINTIQK